MKAIPAILFLFFASYLRAQQVPDTTTVYFDFDRFTLREDAKRTLDSFISAHAASGATSPLQIRGFCDIIGSLQYNDLLSRRRSFAVHDYLLNNGISKESVSLVQSFGERLPVNENRTPWERQLNRRVEIISFGTPAIEITEAPAETTEPVVTELSISVDTVKEGQTIRLKNINFYNARSRFLPQSLPALNELLEIMRRNPTLVIEIQGHICCHIGDSNDAPDLDTNEPRLSENRARAVFEFLVRNGIDSKRMSYKGFAGRVPLVNPEVTEADRTANRRVEIRIISR